jgi:hypothetical protein
MDGLVFEKEIYTLAIDYIPRRRLERFLWKHGTPSLLSFYRINLPGLRDLLARIHQIDNECVSSYQSA